MTVFLLWGQARWSKWPLHHDRDLSRSWLYDKNKLRWRGFGWIDLRFYSGLRPPISR